MICFQISIFEPLETARQTFSILSKDKKKFVIAPELGVDSTGQQVVRHFILTSFDTGNPSKKNSHKVMEAHYEQIKRKEY